MLNQLLLWYIGIPIVLGVTLWYGLRKTQREAWQISAAYTVLGILILGLAFFGSRAIATADYELWNGQVVSKKRVHDSYTRSYDCNCTKNSDGSESCSTCYEDRYTVKWSCDTTVGPYEIDSKDSGSRRVYDSPDPARWTSIKAGDPVAKSMRYTNYIQAVPNSLFATSPKELKETFAGLLPAYPDQIYDIYRVNRFVTPGLALQDSQLWSDQISMMLRELGPKKQVNLIVVVAKTDDPEYEFALRDHWDGVNKNDVVVLIGSKTFPNIDFVRVITWSKVEMFKIELRDSIEALKTVQREPILGLIHAQIMKNFERREMAEFKYLEAEIDPPTWVIVSAVIAQVLLAGGIFGYNAGWFDPILRRMNHFRPGMNRRRRR